MVYLHHTIMSNRLPQPIPLAPTFNPHGHLFVLVFDPDPLVFMISSNVEVLLEGPIDAARFFPHFPPLWDEMLPIKTHCDLSLIRPTHERASHP